MPESQKKQQDLSEPQTKQIPTSTPASLRSSGMLSRVKILRKKFSKHDDLVLLRQVNADHPFVCARGGLMEAWSATAEKIKSVDGFSKQEITGKSAQARFNVLLDNHRSNEKVSAAASGISEEYTETQQLLDELVLAVDEHARVEAKRTLAAREKSETDENTGKLMRDEAVSRLKKRKNRDTGSGAGANSPPKPTIYELIRDDNEKDREMRSKQWQQEQEMHRREKDMELQDRKEEREFKLRLAQLENERYEKLLQLAGLKTLGSNGVNDSFTF